VLGFASGRQGATPETDCEYVECDARILEFEHGRDVRWCVWFPLVLLQFRLASYGSRSACGILFIYLFVCLFHKIRIIDNIRIENITNTHAQTTTTTEK